MQCWSYTENVVKLLNVVLSSADQAKSQLKIMIIFKMVQIIKHELTEIKL